MEPIFNFLLKASSGIVLFYLLYWFFLRKETFYLANRWFLIVSLIISVIIPVFPVHYQVIAGPGNNAEHVMALGDTFKNTITPDNIPVSDSGFPGNQRTFVLLYFAGILFFMARLLSQTAILLYFIIKYKIRNIDGFRIIENRKYQVPFSFLDMIFINPDIHKQDDLPAILAHEKVHIRERHWIDLFITELLTVIFWFNPFIWFFERSVKQNHEYLADKGVLTMGLQAGRYQAILVNQLMGMQVFGITNSLNFALGSTRFKMMTKMKSQKINRLKLALILPVMAILMYSFSVPKYEQTNTQSSEILETTTQPLTIKGVVKTAQNNEPLPGTSIVLKGKTIGTVSDMDGNFTLTDPEPKIDEKTGALCSEVVFSFVGLETLVIKASAEKDNPNATINCRMKETTVGAYHKYDKDKVSKPSVILPDKEDVAQPAKREKDSNSKEEVFYAVEEMPQYPGGSDAFYQFINEMQAKLINAKEIKGKAYIGFTIDKNGKATNINIKKADNELVGISALSIIKQMQDWKPGKQQGKPVPVMFVVGIEF
jgi:hypothetical protein